MGSFLYSEKMENIEQASNSDIINNRRVINGPDDGLMQLSPLKHPWAEAIFKTMLENTWTPNEVSLCQDADMIKNNQLTPEELRVYKRSLAFVSNLDGLQTHNLSNNIMRHITSPEITMALARQTYEEALHVFSYATMVDSLGFDAQEIYGMYRSDQDLYTKNQTVLQAVNKISDTSFQTGTFENDQLFLEACIGNIILEGIYFYSAFLNFYTLNRNNKMPGSAEMIQWINRDEDVHLQLFIHMTEQIKEEQPELWTPAFKERIRQNFIDAVDMEYTWGKSCIGSGILGLIPESLHQYLTFVGDMRLQSIGMDKIWNSTNPFPWIDEMTSGNMMESNFFEKTVREYRTGGLNWD